MILKPNDTLFRPATQADLNDIMDIIDYARQRMLAEGKRQWDEHYPQREHIEADIRGGYGHVLCQSGEVVAYGAILFGKEPEPAYRHLTGGTWLSEQPYVVVHRLAVAGTARGRGFGLLLMSQVESLMRERGVRSFKVDTNFDNFAMQHILEKMHFRYCGDIHYGERGSRMAYEKIIETTKTEWQETPFPY